MCHMVRTPVHVGIHVHACSMQLLVISRSVQSNESCLVWWMQCLVWIQYLADQSSSYKVSGWSVQGLDTLVQELYKLQHMQALSLTNSHNIPIHTLSHEWYLWYATREPNVAFPAVSPQPSFSAYLHMHSHTYSYSLSYTHACAQTYPHVCTI